MDAAESLTVRRRRPSAMGGWLILTTDDCRKTYETLLSRRVEFTEEPTDRP